MGFWNKFKTGLKIVKIGAQVAVAVVPAGKAAKIIGVIAQSADLGDQVSGSIERGEK